MEKLIMTVDEMAEALQISRPKAYELVHSQDGPPVIHVGRCIRIPTNGFMSWLAHRSGQRMGGEAS